MELVVISIMLLVGFSFVLKLSGQGWTVRSIICAVAALFVILACDAASTQSKTQISDWLGRPDLMLDTSVWLTVDVVFQICYCVLGAKALGESLSRKESLVLAVCRYVPGLLIFPVLFATLTALLFAFTGVEFSAVAWSMAAALLVAVPLLAEGFRRLVPESDIRLEMLFMVNVLIAALGIVATVNGRTAAAGTGSVDWPALAAVAALLLGGLAAGYLYFLRKNTFKINRQLK